tara:strand:- start:2901 stop:3353 length:453 start_codon:yes stop_codon:yes gene_type:complete
MTDKPLKPGEETTSAPLSADAGLCFVGHVETPWRDLADCPRQIGFDGPECAVVLAPPWDRALLGIERARHLDLVLWLHRARRDLLTIHPAHADAPRGVFTFRSPVRPNPIGVSQVLLERVQGARLIVRGLEVLDGTPLIDIKPARCPHSV